jgi:hypothetical protein
MFETNQPQPTQNATSKGVSPTAFVLAIIVILAVGGGVAYSYMPKPPTAEEIMATLSPDEAKVRQTYAELVKQGKHEDAKVYAKGVAVTRAESKQSPISFAMTAVEAMHEEPAPQPAKAEKPESGNVQSPPLN